MKKTFLIIFFVTSLPALWGQNQHAKDSLLSLWQNEKVPDTVRLSAIKKCIWDHFLFVQPDSAWILADQQVAMASFCGSRKYEADGINVKGSVLLLTGRLDEALVLFEQSLSLYTSIGDKKGMSSTLNNMGGVYRGQGNYEKAIDCFDKVVKLKKQIGEERGMGTTFGNMGIMYAEIGDYPVALKYFFMGLEIEERYENTKGVARAHNSIGNIYKNIEDFDRARRYYKKSLKVYRELNDLSGISVALSNLGNIYFLEGEKLMAGNERNSLIDTVFSKALFNYSKALDIEEKLQDKSGVAASCLNIGSVHFSKKNYNEALTWFQRSADINKETGDNGGLSISYNNIGRSYNLLGEASTGRTYCMDGLALAERSGAMVAVQSNCQCLYEANKSLGNLPEALRYYERYISLTDSLKNDERTRTIFQKEFEFNYQKKVFSDSLKAVEATKVKNARIETQQAELRIAKTKQYSLLTGLSFLGIFAWFIYIRYKKSRKQNEIIENQRRVVDERNREIMDSIRYAKRIQSAILPARKLVNQYLENSFIYYQPKDIVAGDFYWMEPLTNSSGANVLLFAVADCTGHGVPGALVSVVCHNALNRSVREFGLTEPGQILDKVCEIVIEEFEKSDDDVKDGMDIALCSLNLENGMLQYSGAHNPLWILRKHASEIEEIKGNKQPIGKFDHQSPFTTHSVNVTTGDSIYLFSDGFADQFGGEKGKKYKSTGLKNCLISGKNLSVEEQCDKLKTAFEEWKGPYEQVDDVCVIGVRV